MLCAPPWCASVRAFARFVPGVSPRASTRRPAALARRPQQRGHRKAPQNGKYPVLEKAWRVWCFPFCWAVGSRSDAVGVAAAWQTGRAGSGSDGVVVLKGVKESDKWGKGSPPVESRGSERSPLRSKLSLRGVWVWLDQLPVPDLANSLCLKGEVWSHLQIQLACQSPSQDFHWNSFTKLKE